MKVDWRIKLWNLFWGDNRDDYVVTFTDRYIDSGLGERTYTVSDCYSDGEGNWFLTGESDFEESLREIGVGEHDYIDLDVFKKDAKWMSSIPDSP